MGLDQRTGISVLWILDLGPFLWGRGVWSQRSGWSGVGQGPGRREVVGGSLNVCCAMPMDDGERYARRATRSRGLLVSAINRRTLFQCTEPSTQRSVDSKSRMASENRGKGMSLATFYWLALLRLRLGGGR